jgi:hypothetical protein
MPEPELSLLFIRPLNLAGIRYVVSGSVAAIIYGEPRLTHDVDLLVFLNDKNIQQLPQIFPSSDFYVPPAEVIAAEVSRSQRGHFNIIHVNTGFKADFYPTGRDELSAWAFRNRRSVQFQGETILVAPPECVIVSKLEYYREGGSEKHIRDIRRIRRPNRQVRALRMDPTPRLARAMAENSKLASAPALINTLL